MPHCRRPDTLFQSSKQTGDETRCKPPKAKIHKFGKSECSASTISLHRQFDRVYDWNDNEDRFGTPRTMGRIAIFFTPYSTVLHESISNRSFGIGEDFPSTPETQMDNLIPWPFHEFHLEAQAALHRVIIQSSDPPSWIKSQCRDRSKGPDRGLWVAKSHPQHSCTISYID